MRQRGHKIGVWFLLWIVVVLFVVMAGGCGGGGGGDDESVIDNPVEDPDNPVPDPDDDPSDEPDEPVDPVEDPKDPPVTFYIAPDGNDADDGTGELPLATLAGARDRIRALKAASGMPVNGFVVYLKNGSYAIPSTTEFREEDSGTGNAPIAYRAAPGEKPVLSGGVYFKGGDFQPVTDPEMLARLAADAKAKVVCLNLFDNGFTPDDLDYAKAFWSQGNLIECGVDEYYDNQYQTRRMQVFIDDEALYPARWPNKKAGTFPDNPYDVYLPLPKKILGPAQFVSEEERVRGWKTFEDVVVFGMLGSQYSHDKVVVDTIDRDSLTVTLKCPPTYDLSPEDMRYAFENVFEELDAPGEYYIDRHTGMLYLYPTKNMSGATVKISKLDTAFMIDVENASNVVFSGLTFELTKGSGIWIRGGSDCVVENCTFKNFGGTGVRLGDTAIATRDIGAEYNIPGRFNTYLYDFPAYKNGFRHKVSGCDFTNTGFYACAIYSGNSANRDGGDMLFERNRIRHSGLLGSTYRSGLLLNGVGMTVKNNDFFYCRGQAISGNMLDTEILYNEFCDSPCDMAEDTGTIYLNYLCINEGVKIRYNWFRDVTNEDIRYTGWGFAVRAAVAYDNNSPALDFAYNVISNVPMGTYMPRMYTTSAGMNNLFVDCNDPLHFSMVDYHDWYDGKTPADLLSNTEGHGWVFYTTGIYRNNLWREKYPALYEYFTYMSTEKKDLFQSVDRIYNNLMVNIAVPYERTEKVDVVKSIDPKYGRVENNIYLETDPGFENYAAGKFQLSQKAAERYGVERIDMSKIGSGR